MALQQSGELKKRARLAKQRLKMGYWDQEEKNRSNQASARTVVMGETHTASDEKMYRKVCEMLEKDDTILNPIGQLIDEGVYSSLDSTGKQRYILELSNKFRELKERYYKERTGA